MSEHRSRYRSNLFTGRCQFWPHCHCNSILIHWQHSLEDRDWPISDLKWAETAIFLALSCVEAHCPSQKHRAFAQVQLLNPWWDLQRVGRSRVEQLTDEGANEV
jgi:hypothetical protein